jgi:hypothetical protein
MSESADIISTAIHTPAHNQQFSFTGNDYEYMGRFKCHVTTSHMNGRYVNKTITIGFCTIHFIFAELLIYITAYDQTLNHQSLS